jgi:thiol:disulfide interchange protein
MRSHDVGVDAVGHERADSEHRGSQCSTVAIGAALLAWVGGIGLHVLGVLGPAVAVVGLVAGVIAGRRERRPIWRLTVVVATLACVAALSLYALVLTSTVSWPPTGW